MLGRKISQYQKKSRFFKNRARKVLPKSSQGIAEKFARYCRKVRKVLPKLRWGSKKHSKDSGSGVLARDSELEREELYLNDKKKIISTSIRFRVKIAETHIAHSYRKFIC